MDGSVHLSVAQGTCLWKPLLVQAAAQHCNSGSEMDATAPTRKEPPASLILGTLPAQSNSSNIQSSSCSTSFPGLSLLPLSSIDSTYSHAPDLDNPDIGRDLDSALLNIRQISLR
ncbi:hypothetical protein NXS19_009081 [Fusarium pseudograminearum]|nr:hypothetical protein NXS19_009081 [Fusarium pseudograminearum]